MRLVSAFRRRRRRLRLNTARFRNRLGRGLHVRPVDSIFEYKVSIETDMIQISIFNRSLFLFVRVPSTVPMQSP